MSVPPYVCGAIGLYLFALSSDHRYPHPHPHPPNPHNSNLTQERTRLPHHRFPPPHPHRPHNHHNNPLQHHQILRPLHPPLRILRFRTPHSHLALKQHPRTWQASTGPGRQRLRKYSWRYRIAAFSQAVCAEISGPVLCDVGGYCCGVAGIFGLSVYVGGG